MTGELSGQLFGKTFACSCGRTHRITPEEFIYSDSALELLPEVCARHASTRSAVVLMDTRTRQVAGTSTVAALGRAGWKVTEVLVEDRDDGQSPVCDDVTKAKLSPCVGEDDLVLSVGSGVINDLAKWLAFDAGAPFVAFATAASMNGYASANIAANMHGVKTLLNGRAPLAVLTSPGILRDAPYELTAAGLGDLVSKSVSSADWYVNHLLFGDYYCSSAVELIAKIEPLYLEHPDDLRARKGEVIEALFEALMLTGVAMTMAQTSSPASGGEHLISHALDMISSLDGLGHDLHGRQVGVATILTCELYRRVLELESPRFGEFQSEIDLQFWGRLSGVVAEQYTPKVERVGTVREMLAQSNNWDRLRESIAPMVRPPEQIRNCLASAGGACKAADIAGNCLSSEGSISGEQARMRLLNAFCHAHEIRSRFTILDLAHLTGIMPTAGREIIAQWG